MLVPLQPRKSHAHNSLRSTALHAVPTSNKLRLMPGARDG